MQVSTNYEVRVMKQFFQLNPNGVLGTTTHAVGGGEWSIEVYGIGDDDCKEFLFELVGSNGTHSEPDDLWEELEQIIKLAGKTVNYEEIDL